MFNCKISVVIPTFNRAVTLLRAINSVINQTYPVEEILICDDGSDDNSKNEVFALRNSKIKWIDCGRNGRPSIPRNMGIKNATGDWVAFLDSDDEWLPDKIEIQVKLLIESKSRAVCCNAFRVVNSKKQGPYLSYKKKSIAFTDFLSGNIVICSSAIVDRILLNEISSFPEEKEYTAIEDYALWLRLATKIDFAYYKEPLLNYNDSPQLSIRTYYKDVWQIKQFVFKEMIEWIKKNDLQLKPAIREQLIGACSKELKRKSSPAIAYMKRKLKLSLIRIGIVKSVI